MILSIKGISKTFPGVRALDNVDFELRKGEVHVIVGENGAGKSTLIKICCGLYQADNGYIEIDGQRVNLTNPAIALGLGIGYIPQELALVPSLTVAENVLLGINMKTGPLGLLRPSFLMRQTQEILDQFDMALDPRSTVENLSVAERQMVTIARALARNCRIVIMDEPTASFPEHEIKSLFALIRRLKAQGVSFIYISHNMEEIFDIADRVTVLRNGKLIGTKDIKEVNIPTIIKMMVGSAIGKLFPERKRTPGAEEVLRAEGLNRRGVLYDVNLTLHEGEILGIAGLLGSGRTELLRAIFGLDSLESGKLIIRGSSVLVNSVRKSIALGIGFVPEERKSQGLFLEMSVKHNISIGSIAALAKGILINNRRERDVTKSLMEDLKIRCSSIESQVMNLSGGNQQKVIIARWLGRKSKILFLDDPTRGIDVGAKAEVHKLIAQLVDKGASVLLISSNLEELIGMSDRVIVLCDGHMVGEFTGNNQVTKNRILSAMFNREYVEDQ